MEKPALIKEEEERKKEKGKVSRGREHTQYIKGRGGLVAKSHEIIIIIKKNKIQ
jgi:hypothetical protein